MAREGLEIVLLTVAIVIVSVTYFSEKIGRYTVERAQLLNDLRDVRTESEVWREKAQAHVSGLVGSIKYQFEQWGLTPAEQEVSFLMLKGLGHKEIAIFRDTHESTVRQQARSIYNKAGMQNRGKFCAFFLDDLLPSTHE